MAAAVADGARGGRRRSARREPSSAAVARRQVTARVVDARLWLGIGLVVISMVVGAKVVTAGDDTVTVWRAGRDLSVGSVPGGLEPVVVARSAVTDQYLSADENSATAGLVLSRPVPAGEMLPRSALVPVGSGALRQVTVAVDPLHAPGDLQAGDLVDVWATKREAADAGPARPERVLSAVSVGGRLADGIGVGGEIGIVIEVPESDVGALVAAARSGVLDLVAVPVGSQQAWS